MSAAAGIGLTVALLAVQGARADDVAVSGARRDDEGSLVREVRPSDQAKVAQIRVLLPEKAENGKEYRAVYLLPVEAGTEGRYGDGLREVQKLDLHNGPKAVFVAPTFSHTPWYADHPTKPEVRQESSFVKAVAPFVDKTCPVRAEPDGRLLLGFSKSGWGAWSLLLRRPEVFGRAAAWDAPLMMDSPGRYGSCDVFGTEDNFEGYRVSRLPGGKADVLRQGRRLILLGYGNFRAEHERAHALMDELKVAQEYRDGPARKSASRGRNYAGCTSPPRWAWSRSAYARRPGRFG